MASQAQVCCCYSCGTCVVGLDAPDGDDRITLFVDRVSHQKLQLTDLKCSRVTIINVRHDSTAQRHLEVCCIILMSLALVCNAQPAASARNKGANKVGSVRCIWFCGCWKAASYSCCAAANYRIPYDDKFGKLLQLEQLDNSSLIAASRVPLGAAYETCQVLRANLLQSL